MISLLKITLVPVILLTELTVLILAIAFETITGSTALERVVYWLDDVGSWTFGKQTV